MLRAIFRNPLVEWMVMIIAVMAGIVAVKFLISYLPNGGLIGGIKQTALSV